MTPEERAREIVTGWSVDEPLSEGVDWATGGKTNLVETIARALTEAIAEERAVWQRAICEGCAKGEAENDHHCEAARIRAQGVDDDAAAHE